MSKWGLRKLHHQFILELFALDNSTKKYDTNKWLYTTPLWKFMQNSCIKAIPLRSVMPTSGVIKFLSDF